MTIDRPRVLVVEDRPGVLKLMTTILESAYAVTAASDGAAALRLLHEETFEVVLTDIRLPGASGFEVLRTLREGPSRDAALVMMTAYANVPDAVAAMRLGAYDYVAKPLDADEILLVVARAAEHARGAAAAGSGAIARAEVDEVAAGDGPEIQVAFRRAVEEARDRASRAYLQRLMREFHGNVTQASTRAGMTRESLHRVMRRYGVRSGGEEHHAVAAVGDGAA